MKLAQINFKFHAPVDDPQKFAEFLQSAALDAGAEDSVAFFKGEVIGLHVPFMDDVADVIDAGRVLGYVQSQYHSARSARAALIWFSVHELDGTEISTTAIPGWQ